MKIPAAVQFAELDKYTIVHEPVASVDLMERAATALTAELRRRWGTDTRFVVFAGPGNNGGDALAVSRMLCQAGYKADTYLFNISGRLSDDCAINKTRLQAVAGAQLTEVTEQFAFPDTNRDDVILDGLFGTGLNKPLKGGFASIVKHINSSPATTVSIDMPSGLMSENNAGHRPDAIVHASLTLTMELPKLAFFFAENYRYTGEVRILPIGLHPDGIEQLKTDISVLEEADVKRLLHTRNPYSHKGNMGHVLLVGGQYGMAGAAVLAARACLRSGAGKLTIHSAELNNNILQCCVPEAMVSHDVSDTIVSEAIPTDRYSVLAVGPGLGTDESTAQAVHTFVRNHAGGTVLDADALNILGAHPEWLPELPQESILTPHPKELENLTGFCTDSYDRMVKSRELAVKLQLYIIIKGHHTMICTPGGHVHINPTGNAGMATAGSGDVLTGVLAGLLACNYSPEEACLLGVYLHGLAGDIARDELGEESMTAGDIAEHLPAAFKKLRNNK